MYIRDCLQAMHVRRWENKPRTKEKAAKRKAAAVERLCVKQEITKSTTWRIGYILASYGVFQVNLFVYITECITFGISANHSLFGSPCIPN